MLAACVHVDVSDVVTLRLSETFSPVFPAADALADEDDDDELEPPHAARDNAIIVARPIVMNFFIINPSVFNFYLIKISF